MRLPRRLVKHDVLLDRSNSYQWDARIKIGSPSYGQNDCRPSQQKKSCWSRLMMTMQKLHPKAQNAFFPNSSATVRPCTPIPMQPFSSPVLSRDRGHLVPNRSGSLGAVKLPSESFITKRSHMTSGLYQLELLKEQMACVRRNDFILIDRLHQLEGEISSGQQKTHSCPGDSEQRTCFTIPRCLRGKVQSFDT
ncbi:hypothetical protein M514_02000 [Trichuris suis]|uniref:Uncharacterized protein n=1 Tax=Trichuris suis TaxID=68888 RepID=A0A085NJI8_9BILA|nr:hypothetical protein M513_02000 [Trichuris suis]KFD69634.1 hypothetical protein M514_02000 [Trichuris suis]